MTEQPTALRLADAQECVTDDNCGWCPPCSVAAELRRLSAVEAQRDALLEACKTLVALPGTEDWATTLRLAVEQARAAIKAVEEK